MRRPNVDLRLAVKTHCEKLEMGTNDIAFLFSCSPKKARELKRIAQLYQESEGVKSYHPDRVNTKSAYRAWGLDIKELESNFLRMRRMGAYDE